MSDTITLDELKAQVGGDPRHSEWYTLDQSRIDAFAAATDDHQFIHCDPEAAKNTPFGGTIAHGFLSLSMLSTMSYDSEKALENTAMAINYGFDKVRFTSPVASGKRVRAKFITRAVEEKGDGILVTRGVTIEIEGESRPALTAQWLGYTVLEKAT
ncbi:MaoC family dehydratase [Ahrensia sp. R2A130]|uniref:MaoC family dehydratase n=1 Tax=Ahrensia sp. R2A130 TaxID=744979 RepID=UPI0001E0F0F2|nr:MaoC family dehydratase [Ahrensia sp. R2A130]EFL89020.1 nodulation protein N [Ahrensia sp. R2A130]